MTRLALEGRSSFFSSSNVQGREHLFCLFFVYRKSNDSLRLPVHRKDFINKLAMLCALTHMHTIITLGRTRQP